LFVCTQRPPLPIHNHNGGTLNSYCISPLSGPIKGIVRRYGPGGGWLINHNHFTADPTSDGDNASSVRVTCALRGVTVLLVLVSRLIYKPYMLHCKRTNRSPSPRPNDIMVSRSFINCYITNILFRMQYTSFVLYVDYRLCRTRITSTNF
jgi:hypothetical protein